MVNYSIIDLSNNTNFSYNSLTKTLSLTQDISWDGSDYITLNEGERFDGKGYTISFSSNTLGLIEVLGSENNKCIIKNVGITNGSLLTNERSYLLRKSSSNCIIKNSYNNASINQNDSGGLVGFKCNNIDLINCYNTGSITGINSGGLVANDCSNTILINCYNTGSISGANAGGLVGNNNTNSIIKNCYNTGSVNGSDAGGLVGSNYAKASIGIIQNCYTTTSNLTGSNAAEQDFDTSIIGFCVIQNCYSSGSSFTNADQSFNSGTSNISGNYNINDLNNINLQTILTDISLNNSSSYTFNNVTYSNDGAAFSIVDNNYPVLKSFLNSPWLDTDYSSYDASVNFLQNDTNLSNSNYNISNIPYGILLDNTSNYLDASVNNLNLGSSWTFEVIFRPLKQDISSVILDLNNSYSLNYNGSTKKLNLQNISLDVPQDNKFHHYIFTSAGFGYIDNSTPAINVSVISLTQSGTQNLKIGGNSFIELLSLRLWSSVKNIQNDCLNYGYSELPLEKITDDLVLNVSFTNRNRIHKTYYDNTNYENNLTYSGTPSLTIPTVSNLSFSETIYKEGDLYTTDLSYNRNDETGYSLNFNYINESGYTLQSNELINISIPSNYDNTNNIYSKTVNYNVNESYYDISYQYYTTNGFYVSDLGVVEIHYDYAPVWNVDASYDFSFNEDKYFSNEYTLILDYEYINIDLSNQYDLSLVVVSKEVTSYNNSSFNNATDLFNVFVEDVETGPNGFTNSENNKLNKELHLQTLLENFYGTIEFTIKAFNIRNSDLSLNKTFTITFNSVNDPIEWVSNQFGTSSNRISFDEFTTETITITKNDLSDNDLTFNPETFADLSFILYNSYPDSLFSSSIVSSSVIRSDANNVTISFTGLKDQTGTVDGIIHVFDTTNSDLSSNINFYLSVEDANEEFTYSDNSLNTILNNESKAFFYDSKLSITLSDLISDNETSDASINIQITNYYSNIITITYDNSNQLLDISSIITEASLNELTNEKYIDMSFVLAISDRYQTGALANTRSFTHNLRINKYILENLLNGRPLRQYVNDFFNGFINYDSNNKLYTITNNFSLYDICKKHNVDLDQSYNIIIERGSSINGSSKLIDLRNMIINNSLFNVYELDVIDNKVERNNQDYTIDVNSTIININKLGLVNGGPIINSSNVNITSCYGKDCGALLGLNVENATLEKCKLINHNSFGGVNPTIKLCYIENENELTIYDEYSNNYVVTVN